MGESCDQSKLALRAQLRQKLMALDAAQLSARSHAAAERLIATPAFRAATAVMLFLPLKYEIDARPVALKAWQAFKTVTVPLVGYEQKHMIPVVIKSLEESLVSDRFGVRTPRAAEPFPVEMIDLVVVPGLGFDRAGHRIGRGSGFYDRFLSQPRFRGTTCGLGLHEQVVGQVPCAAHDVRLDMLVTDREVMRFATKVA